MSTRRLVAAGIGVTALLAVAGIASRGRPLAGERGAGPTATFFDYLATTLLILFVLMLAVFLWAVFSERTGGWTPRRGRWHVLSMFVSLAGALLISWVILHTGFEQRLRKAAQEYAKRQAHAQTQPPARADGKNIRSARVRWDEIAIVLALLGGTAAIVVARRRTRRPTTFRLRRREEAVSEALDESLDDLRNDPDLRRAIVAAYARMERALAAVGLPRHPAEAPFEYVERALTSLDTSAESAERLTALFEWAKFSHHEPEPEMRDEAVDALVAVRDELRRPVPEAVEA